MGASSRLFGETEVAVMVTVVLLTTLLTPLFMRWAFKLPCPHDSDLGGTEQPEKVLEYSWD
jgi:hypothetical protein